MRPETIGCKLDVSGRGFFFFMVDIVPRMKFGIEASDFVAYDDMYSRVRNLACSVSKFAYTLVGDGLLELFLEMGVFL